MSQDAWRVERYKDDLLLVTFDCPDRSVNTFSRAVLQQLDQLLDELAKTASASGVLIRSGKPGNFAAGADLDEVVQIGTAHEAAELSGFGQKVFRKLERLPLTTVALVSGACLGGGLEFALACDYLIADEDPRTLLGFPEVLIGLIPGWGGTVRARRRLGLQAAVQAVTTATRYNGRQARRLGLVDDVVPTEALLAAGAWFVRHRPPHKKGWLRLATDNRWVGRLILRTARQRILTTTYGQYPAPLHVVRVFQVGLERGVSGQYEAERTAIADLATHPVTRKLMRIFFLQEEAKKRARERTEEARTVHRVAIVGAGIMGAGIAALFAQRGVEVRLKDIRPDLVAKGMYRIREHVRRQVRRGRMNAKQAEELLQRIYPTVDYTGFKLAELVIEAVVEDAAVKRQVFRELFERIGPETVVATNTSSFSLASLAGADIDQDRFLAMHFFNPPHRMRLVEVAWTERTAPWARATVLQMALRLGKTPIVVGDCHGFVVNRLLTAYLNQIGYLLLLVDDPLQLEEAMKRFGFPMGPLELLDLVGLGVAQKVAANLYAAYGGRMKPAPLFEQLGTASERSGPRKLIQRASWFRKKSAARELIAAIDTVRRQHGRLPLSLPANPEAIAQYAVAPMLNEAVLMIQEGLVEIPDQIDLAMILGAGFPPFRGGPVSYGDDLGWDRVREILQRLAAARPELGPCRLLLELAQEGTRLTRDRTPTRTATRQAQPGEKVPDGGSGDEPIPLSDI